MSSVTTPSGTVEQTFPISKALPVDVFKPTAPKGAPSNDDQLEDMTIAQVRGNHQDFKLPVKPVKPIPPGKVAFTVPDRSNKSKPEELSHTADYPRTSNQTGAQNSSEKIPVRVPQRWADTNTQDRGIVPPEQLGENPAFIDCPYCKRRSITTVEETNSSATNNVEHRCQNCRKLVARQPHGGNMQAVLPTQQSDYESQREPMPEARLRDLERGS
ncbi:hypothetical protein E8E14_002335 [Neopestalotiopsis sp. 37M]|nr:hypothetical protein E8E14_002335 [Neopestalotiopsis sp. 37M]